MGIVVTIDGPAASGKTSVSRELAKLLKCPWVSTGAFYRGLAYAAHHSGVDLSDPVALTEFSVRPVWNIEMTSEKTKAFFNNLDVTDEISKEDVGNMASKISQFSQVRQSLLDIQRSCAFNHWCLIAEGRDCGTVVFPHAEIKVYLTARSEDRAKRRSDELGIDRQVTEQLQRERDSQDSNRATAPLQIPRDALVLDTTQLDLSTVVAKVLEHVKFVIDPLLKKT